MSSIILGYDAFDAYLAMLHHLESLTEYRMNSAKKIRTYINDLTVLLCESYKAREIFLQNNGDVWIHVNNSTGNIVKFDGKDIKEFKKV